MQKISTSNVIKGVLIGLGALIVLILVFNLGLLVGYRKALFSDRWGENYENNFIGQRPLAGFHSADFLNADSTAGVVLSVEGTTIIIKDNQNTERTVLVSTTTTIREGDQTISSSDIKTDDQVTVIGEPNSTGQLEAKFIRVFSPAGNGSAGNPAPNLAPSSAPAPAVPSTSTS